MVVSPSSNPERRREYARHQGSERETAHHVRVNKKSGAPGSTRNSALEPESETHRESGEMVSMYPGTNHELGPVRSRQRRSVSTSLSATPRVLTYSTRDVIDNRISIPAQHGLVRLSKNPVTSADAVAMLGDSKQGGSQESFVLTGKFQRNEQSDLACRGGRSFRKPRIPFSCWILTTH